MELYESLRLIGRVSNSATIMAEMLESGGPCQGGLGSRGGVLAGDSNSSTKKLTIGIFRWRKVAWTLVSMA